MTARNSEELVKLQQKSLKMQRDAAVANIAAMGHLAAQQDQMIAERQRGNELASQANAQLASISSELSALQYLTGETNRILDEGFADIAAKMLAQQKILREISEVLQRPYETQALELLQHAERALTQGMKSSGRDQQEEYQDATRLLRQTLDNAIGSRNYVAWFQTGWLHWKNDNDLAKAEEAFYQSSRLSAAEANLYHLRALSHLAYMQYLQGRHDDAYASIHKALDVAPDDHDLLYDAARYAAKTGRLDECLELLDKCIGLRPPTIITMFAEEDFLSSPPLPLRMSELVEKRTKAGRAQAQKAIDDWAEARRQCLAMLANCRQALAKAGCDSATVLGPEATTMLVDPAEVDFSACQHEAARASYLQALAITDESEGQCHQLLSHGVQVIRAMQLGLHGQAQKMKELCDVKHNQIAKVKSDIEKSENNSGFFDRLFKTEAHRDLLVQLTVQEQEIR